MAAPLFEQLTGTEAVLTAALVAVVLGTVLEGIVVGLVQERVVRQQLVSLRPGSWTLATALGAALAWLLGMIPNTIVAIRTSQMQDSASSELGAAIKYGLAAILGLVAGPILGAAQWTVLRRFVPNAVRWLWANALAWAAGMPMIFAGMDLVPWTSHYATIALAIYALCGATGVVVGAIHGRVLTRHLEESSTTAIRSGQGRDVP